MKFDPLVFSLIADVFVNLAAGWFAAIFIVPNFDKQKGILKILRLLFNFLAAILCLIIAFILKTL